VIVGIRPEHLEDAALAPDVPQGRRIKGEVALTEALGAEIVVHVKSDASPAYTEDVKELARDAGGVPQAEVLSENGGAVLVGRFGARSRLRPGEPAEIAVDTSGLHFFDPDSGLGIYQTPEEGSH
jgi:multiple sugar transport system ATP-binding protein